MIPFIDFDNDFLDTEALLFLAGASGGKGVEATATGNPLVFTTDLARPLKSLLIPFTPKQSGTGDPSPENIRSIVPWNGLKVWNGGKNLFNKETVSTGVWWKGSVLGGYPNHRASALIPVKAGSYYTIDRNSNAQNAVCLFDKNRSYVDQLTFDNYIKARIIPDGICFIGITVSADALDTAMVYAGQTASAYEEYKPITETSIPFASPVYGGTLDVVSGVLTVEWTLAHLKQLAWNNYAGNIMFFADIQKDKLSNTAYCDYFPVTSSQPTTDETLGVVATSSGYSGAYLFFRKEGLSSVQDFKNWLNGLEYDPVVSFKLDTPQTVTLTQTQISALVGCNTIWSDADGQMTAVYLKKG